MRTLEQLNIHLRLARTMGYQTAIVHALIVHRLVSKRRRARGGAKQRVSIGAREASETLPLSQQTIRKILIVLVQAGLVERAEMYGKGAHEYSLLPASKPYVALPTWNRITRKGGRGE